MILEKMTSRNFSSPAKKLRTSASAAIFTNIVRACWAICWQLVSTLVSLKAHKVCHVLGGPELGP